jgi:membrane protein
MLVITEISVIVCNNHMNIKEIIKYRFYKIIGFMRFVIIHFYRDDCTYIASALAFTTLLAIVPLMSVGLAFLSSFPVFKGFNLTVQNFIFENFVPSTSQVIQVYLQQFANQISNQSIVGIIFVFITALLLMVTIEQAMNKIWRVTIQREGVTAFLLYWAILSLAPVFLGLSLAASSFLFSMSYFSTNQLSFLLLNSLPFIFSLAGFTFLYVVVPNCPVKLHHGLVGGFVAAILFEAAKQGFAWYLSHYNSYELIYGAFATIPVFFVWVYWIWLITLLGAEISYALSVAHLRRTGQVMDGFSQALLWLHLLWNKQKNGQGATQNELIEATDQPYAIDIITMINELKRINLVDYAENGNLFLGRDLHDVSLYWLSQQLPYPLPTRNELQEENPLSHFKWHTIFRKNNELMEKTLAMNLGQLFSSEQSITDSSGDAKSI